MNRSTPLPVALLAGGLATRLRPITDVIPKSMVAINGEPFIAHQLRNLREAGLRRVVILCGYLGDQIAAYVGDGSRFGLDVAYVHDGPILLGTAGAIKRAIPRLGPVFFTLYGDSYLTCDYLGIQARFLADGRKALMTVYRNDGLFDSSNVIWDREIRLYDKRNKCEDMHHIDYGLGIFHASAFDDVPDAQPADLSAVYQRRLAESQLMGVEVFERFYEIGSVAGINDLSSYLLSHPLPNVATE